MDQIRTLAAATAQSIWEAAVGLDLTSRCMWNAAPITSPLSVTSDRSSRRFSDRRHEGCFKADVYGRTVHRREGGMIHVPGTRRSNLSVPSAGEVVGRQNPPECPPRGQTRSTLVWEGHTGPCGSVAQQSGWRRHTRKKPSLQPPQQGSHQGPAQPRLWKGGHGPAWHHHQCWVRTV